MFSGIIEKTGRIQFHSHSKLGVQTGRFRVKKGDSVAVNGVCLTVTQLTKLKGDKMALHFDLSEETLQKTTLRNLPLGAPLNLETALKASDFLGGHIVQGHVDGMGRVQKIISSPNMTTIWFKAPKDIMRYLVSKGSVTVDGVSLTVVSLTAASFSVALIPYTLRHTNLGGLRVGESVNVEADIIGKYVAKYLNK